MRIFNLFIILILVICAGGLCSAPLSYAASYDQNNESCHAMDHTTKADTTLNIEQDDKKKIDIDSSCCNEYLTNSLSDNYQVAIYTEEIHYPLQVSSIISSNQLKNRSQREHDPPDLHILNSIFLI